MFRAIATFVTRAAQSYAAFRLPPPYEPPPEYPGVPTTCPFWRGSAQQPPLTDDQQKELRVKLEQLFKECR